MRRSCPLLLKLDYLMHWEECDWGWDQGLGRENHWKKKRKEILLSKPNFLANTLYLHDDKKKRGK